MNIHRNVLKAVAGALLVVSLPAGAQVLGGGLGGAANAALGGGLGGARIDGAASAAGNATFDASDALGAARHGVRRAGGTAHEAAGRTAGAARSQVQSARGASDASVQAAQSVGVRTSRRAERSAARTSASAEQTGAVQLETQPRGVVLLSGTGDARAEQHAIGRSIATQGSAGSQARADRSGFSSSTDGQTSVSMKKDEPASPAE